MRFSFIVILLSLCVALPASAQLPATAPEAANQDSIEVWHQKMRAKFSQLNYLGEDGKPMTAQEFLEIVARRSAGISMTSRGEAEMTLQVMTPAQAESAKQVGTAQWHQKLRVKYKRLNYLDVDGKPLTEQAFVETMGRGSKLFMIRESDQRAEEATVQVIKPGAAG